MPYICDTDPERQLAWKAWISPNSFDDHLIPYFLNNGIVLAFHPRRIVLSEIDTIRITKPKLPFHRSLYLNIDGTHKGELAWTFIGEVPREFSEMHQLIDYLHQTKTMPLIEKIYQKGESYINNYTEIH